MNLKAATLQNQPQHPWLIKESASRCRIDLLYVQAAKLPLYSCTISRSVKSPGWVKEQGLDHKDIESPFV